MIRATDVAARLALRRYPRSWRGRCPCCDYGGNTFSMRADRQGRALLYCANGCGQKELIDAAARATGQPPIVPRIETGGVDTHDHKRELALRLWRGSDAASGTLADRYLSGRGLPGLAASPALRFRSDCPHPEGGRRPALIALVTDAAGQPIAVHRTFLAPDGGKAKVEPAKASLGPVWRGAVRLAPVIPGTSLVIGEGVETSASAGRLMGLPAWAAVSAGNLAKGLTLPPDVRRVVIATDPDRPGRDAARDAWLRWTAEGREVRIATPDGAGDFNDLLRAPEANHAE